MKNRKTVTKNIEEVKINEKELLELLELWEKGLTNIEIAKEMNRNNMSIYTVLTRLGKKCNKKKKEDLEKSFKERRKFDPSKEELFELKITLSYRQIAKIYNVSAVAVVKRFQKLELIAPPKKRIMEQ